MKVTKCLENKLEQTEKLMEQLKEDRKNLEKIISHIDDVFLTLGYLSLKIKYEIKKQEDNE